MSKFAVRFVSNKKLVTQDDVPRSLAYDITNPSEEDGVIRLDTRIQAEKLQHWVNSITTVVEEA